MLSSLSSLTSLCGEGGWLSRRILLDLRLIPGSVQHKLGMMSLHCILVEPAYCSGSDLAGQASGVSWVEKSVGVIQQIDLLINSEGKDMIIEEKITITGLDSTLTLVVH